MLDGFKCPRPGEFDVFVQIKSMDHSEPIQEFLVGDWTQSNHPLWPRFSPDDLVFSFFTGAKGRPDVFMVNKKQVYSAFNCVF
jgi:hypothetical protein